MTASLDQIRWPVRTDRLVLRRATVDDVDATYRIRCVPGVADFLTAAPTDRAAHARRFTDPDRLVRLLVVELDGPEGPDGPTFIGDMMISIEDAWSQVEVAELAAGRQAELGWVLDPAHRGRGYASEAVTAAIRLCFEVLGLRRVVAHCFAANEASWRLMERVGMRRETHTIRESLHRSGEWMDGFSYALLADEWVSRRHG